MTLIITELSEFGIAMAADSAVTYTDALGIPWAKPNVAKKLQFIPYLNAGISCWGAAEMEGISTDKWLKLLIKSQKSVNSLRDFAVRLEEKLNRIFGPGDGNSRMGFHLAGFENFDGKPTPSFFHIHDGPSTTLKMRGISIDPTRFNANHDIPPEISDQLIQSGNRWITRNGDYQLYAQIFEKLETLFWSLSEINIKIPDSKNINDRADYLVFQIRTVSEIYRISSLIPGIGGSIYSLAIAPDGTHSKEKRKF